jgi:hypothetical protein
MFLRMKNSCISRPEVDPLDRKVKVLPAIDLEKFYALVQAGAGACDKIGLEALVFGALGNRLGGVDRAAGMNAGQPAEPGELGLIVAEGGDGPAA